MSYMNQQSPSPPVVLDNADSYYGFPISFPLKKAAKKWEIVAECLGVQC